MLDFFINPALLAGLAGLSLPVLAHLLSRRKYDVVEWGAMQFLELSQNTRRKVRLEELLLLLVRMGLIALIVFALSRPWMQNGLLGDIGSGQSRDVVFVIDGSYSMGYEGLDQTPHDKARTFARKFIQSLNSGDTVQIIDARDKPRLLFDSPTRDFRRVREALDNLPEPAGTSRLSEAVGQAVRSLSSTSNLAREIIVLSDRQRLAWQPEQTTLWTRIDARVADANLKPKIWAVDVGAADAGNDPNYYLSQITLSREVTVPGFPVFFRATLSGTGGGKSSNRTVHLEVDGQRLDSRKQVVPIGPDGSATLEFEHRFTTAGSHRVRLLLDDDSLPGDNQSQAAVVVSPAVPVLLIDGDPGANPAVRETRFLKDALTPSLNPDPWVRAIEKGVNEWTAEDLKTTDVVVLANVASLTEPQIDLLTDYVSRGGGLFVTLGDKVDQVSYAGQLWSDGRGLLPALPLQIDSAPDDEPAAAPDDDTPPEDNSVRVSNDSLDLDWMQGFRLEEDGGFTEARYTQWWTTKLAPRLRTETEGEDGAETDADADEDEEANTPPPAQSPIVAARLDNGAPLLVTRRFGRGMVALYTSTADADWNTLISRHDYVALMHEVVFRLAAVKEQRNVRVGMPLVLPLDPEVTRDNWLWRRPDDETVEPTRTGDELAPLAVLDDTSLAGLYRFEPPKDDAAARPEFFVATSSRDESDLKPVTEADAELLGENDRLTFIGPDESLETLKEQMFADDSKSELWHLLLLLFLAFLVFEVWMTRRLVKGGHEVEEKEDEVIVLQPDAVMLTPVTAAPSSSAEPTRRATRRPPPRRVE